MNGLPPMNVILDNIWMIGLALLGGSFIIQVAPIKIDPWTYIFKCLGKALNSEVNDKLDTVSKKVEEIEVRVISHEEEREEDRALEARRRILRFSDECIRKERHSREYFSNIMDDITFYKNYCDTHKGFKNEKCVMSIEVIERAYRHCTDSNDFLE